jgi:hypothetical protein
MGGGHEPIDGPALSRALDILAEPLDADSSRLAQCRAAIDAQLNAKLANVRALIAAGKNADAKQALDDIDAQYGGLAAPETVELATRIGAP